jgi:hypothetical protein
MKKPIKFFICRQCRAQLGAYGFICKDLVEEVCYSHLGGFHSKFKEDAPPYFKIIVEFLEMNGYIVTHEKGDSYIYLKPVYEEGRGYFCWCKL